MNKTYVKPEVRVLAFASESILAASTMTTGVYETSTETVLGKQAFYEYEEGEEEDYAW